ncbi:MAG: PilZ domain-containing protein [Acidiferrobacterales bacterium]
MSENRRHERYAMSLEVEVFYAETGKLTLNTKDISDGGVFLYMPGQARPSVGTIMNLKLRGLLGGEEPPTVKVKVVRVTDDGVGLQFITED